MTDIYTPEQASAVIGLKPRTIIKRCIDGSIKGAKKHGRQWVLTAEAVEAERARVAKKPNKKAPDNPGGRQISLKTDRPPRPVNEYTAPVGVAQADERAANRARLDEIASKAKSALYIGTDGRAKTVRRKR